MSDRLTTEQQNRNAKNRGNWQRAEPHRRRVTELLVGLEKVPQVIGPRESTHLAILGAGNANDLDLTRLSLHFGKVDLFDLDKSALHHGFVAQDSPRFVFLRGGGDLTGVWTQLESCQPLAPGDEAFDRLIRDSAAPLRLVDETYAVVASTCLLSQLIDAVAITLGTDHPRFLEVVLAIRDGHLKLMADLLEPGGAGVLITDFVSSVTAPALPSLSPEALPGELSKMIQTGNFFTGLNPFAIVQRLDEFSTALGIDSNSIECLTPWLWDFGPRVYAVTAITFHKDPQRT